MNKGKAFYIDELKDNIVKMSVLLKAIHRFKAVSIKILTKFFNNEKKIQIKIMWNQKGL
jgi:hypothetical protein